MNQEQWHKHQDQDRISNPGSRTSGLDLPRAVTLRPSVPWSPNLILPSSCIGRAPGLLREMDSTVSHTAVFCASDAEAVPTLLDEVGQQPCAVSVGQKSKASAASAVW